MPEPTAELQALRASTADLVQGLDEERWSDVDVGVESLCTGWTRGHVLTHLARNADGIAATLAGALRGEIVPRYPDGPDGRNVDIEAGASRSLATLVADVQDSADRLDRVLGALSDSDGWDLPTAEGGIARGWVIRRWREVEVHRVDLAGDYTPDRWPPLLVSALLPDAADSLADRADGAVRVAVSAEGSVVPEFAGREWAAGEGAPVEVTGPDWAVLAWLIGRGAAAAGALTATPGLRPWN